MNVRMRTLPLASLLLVSLLGCADQPLVCTESFAMIPLTVLTPAGAPVSGLVISATTVRTGQTFAIPQQSGFGEPGRYVVFDDSFRDRIRMSGDSVLVSGAGALQFSARFIFDVPGGCHVRKVAGPDTAWVK
jgi:hypothetical protein